MILMVIAHPDDELLFGWPMLQWAKEQQEEIKIISCCSDRDNRLRPAYVNRAMSFYQVAIQLGLQSNCLDYHSGVSCNREASVALCEQLQVLIKAAAPTALFTHNYWGEYGHSDHRLLHQLCLSLRLPVYQTDIVFRTDWPRLSSGPFSLTKVASSRLDHSWYDTCAAIYKRQNHWSWSFGDREEANLLLYSPPAGV